MCDHPVDDFVLLFLHEIGDSPPSKSHFARVCVVPLIIIIHNLFGLMLCNFLNIDNFRLLKLVDFNKFSKHLIFNNDFACGSILFVVEDPDTFEFGVHAPHFVVATHFHVEKFGQYAVKASLGVLGVVHEGAPRLVGRVQSSLFETPDQVVCADVLDSNLAHEKCVVLVSLEELRDDVLSHFLEDIESLSLFGSLNIYKFFEPLLNSHVLLTISEFLQAPRKLPPLACL